MTEVRKIAVEVTADAGRAVETMENLRRAFAEARKSVHVPEEAVTALAAVAIVQDRLERVEERLRSIEERL